MKNTKSVSRTKTPESARKEVFRLLWRIMSYHDEQLPTFGCVICALDKLSVGYIEGYGNICGSCSKRDDRVILYPSYKDIIKLEKLGFLMPKVSVNYNFLIKKSKYK